MVLKKIKDFMFRPYRSALLNQGIELTEHHLLEHIAVVRPGHLKLQRWS